MFSIIKTYLCQFLAQSGNIDFCHLDDVTTVNSVTLSQSSRTLSLILTLILTVILTLTLILTLAVILTLIAGINGCHAQKLIRVDPSGIKGINLWRTIEHVTKDNRTIGHVTKDNGTTDHVTC